LSWIQKNSRRKAKTKKSATKLVFHPQIHDSLTLDKRKSRFNKSGQTQQPTTLLSTGKENQTRIQKKRVGPDVCQQVPTGVYTIDEIFSLICWLLILHTPFSL
jgi:hypothetical protein